MFQIIGMGFSMNVARKAVYVTKNSGAEAAIDWVMNHMGDSDFEEVHPDLKGSRKVSNETVDPRIEELTQLGISLFIRTKYNVYEFRLSRAQSEARFETNWW